MGRRRTRRNGYAARIYIRWRIFDCDDSSIGSLDDSSGRMVANILRQLTVVGIYHPSMLRRDWRLGMEDGILLRGQFLSIPARSGRYGSEPFVENAEMVERRVRELLFKTDTAS